MSREPLGGPFRHGLTFIATLAFVVSFFGSRLFATLFPTTVVMQGGIHLHHFWYGIALISVAGWMGIAWRNERLYRLYALTYLFFVAAISFVIIATLFLRYRAQLQEELLKLSFRERLAMIGVFLTGFSVFFFFLSSGISLVGIPLSLCGLAILVWVYVRRRKPRAIQDAQQE